MADKQVARLLLLLALAAAVLAGKDPSKPVDGVAIASAPKTHQPPASLVTKKAPHGKREVASYGLPQQQHHHRYSLGHTSQLPEFYAPATSHGSYSYSIPSHSPFPHGSFATHKLFVGAPSVGGLKYSPSVGSSHAFFSPLGHQSHPSFGGFPDVKYGSGGFGTKDLSDILKQLHSVGPLTIKAIPSSYGYGSFGEHDTGSSPVLFDSNALHLKPMTFKIHELPSYSHAPSGLPHAAALTAPAGPTSSSSTYGHVAHQLTYEPSYASGVKGLRHYSTPNVPASDLYSGNKYISTVNLHQPTTATMVSPLHTSVHSTLGHQKPFKPSTFLGSTHETVSSPSSAHPGSYLAPSLQYLPPVSKVTSHPHKVSYDSPAKNGGYLPPAAPSTNAYLPPHSKPAHGYLPPVASTVPSLIGSHEDTVRKPAHHHQHYHHVDHSDENLDYGETTIPPLSEDASHHWKH